MSTPQFKVGRRRYDSFQQALQAALGTRRAEINLPEQFTVQRTFDLPEGITLRCSPGGSTLRGSVPLLKVSGERKVCAVIGELTLDFSGTGEAVHVTNGAKLSVDYLVVKLKSSGGPAVVVHGLNSSLQVGVGHDRRRSRRPVRNRLGGAIRSSRASIAVRNHGSFIGLGLQIVGHVSIATGGTVDLVSATVVGNGCRGYPGFSVTGRGSKCNIVRSSVDAFDVAYIRVTGGGILTSKDCSYGMNTPSAPPHAIELRHEESSASLSADRVTTAQNAVLSCSSASLEARGVTISKGSIGVHCIGKGEMHNGEGASYGIVLFGEGCQIKDVSVGVDLGPYTRCNVGETTIRTRRTDKTSAGIVVFGSMSHCRLHGSVTIEESETGVNVLNGGRLEANGSFEKGCVVSGCGAGLLCREGAVAEVTNCLFSSNKQHVVLNHRSQCTLNGCTTEGAEEEAFSSQGKSMIFLFGNNLCDPARVLPRQGGDGIEPVELYGAGAYNVGLEVDDAKTSLHVRLDWVAEVCLEHTPGEEVAVVAMKELYKRCDYRLREILVGKEDRFSSLYLGMINILPYTDLLAFWAPEKLDLAPLALLEEVSMVANGGTDELRALAVERYAKVVERARVAPEAYVSQYYSLLKWHHPAAWVLLQLMEDYADEEQHRAVVNSMVLAKPTFPTTLRGSWVRLWAASKLFDKHIKSYEPAASVEKDMFIPWCDYHLDRGITKEVDSELVRRGRDLTLKNGLTICWERHREGVRKLSWIREKEKSCLREVEEKFSVADALPGPLRRMAKNMSVKELLTLAPNFSSKRRYELLVCLLFEHITPDSTSASRPASSGKCPSCFQEGLKPNQFFAMANCDQNHSLCISCTHTAFQVNKNAKLHCPGGSKCGAKATRSDLLRLYGEEEAFKYMRMQVEAVLLRTNGRQICMDKTCGIGAIVEKGKEWFECVACGKKSSQSGIDVDPFIASQLLIGFQASSNRNGDKVWRECYYCSSVIVKGPSCSTLTCANCYEEFDFVYGNRSDYRKLVGKQKSHVYDMKGVAPQHYVPQGNSVLAQLGVFDVKKSGQKLRPGDVLHPINDRHTVNALCRRARGELEKLGWSM